VFCCSTTHLVPLVVIVPSMAIPGQLLDELLELELDPLLDVELPDVVLVVDAANAYPADVATPTAKTVTRV
jgi:hypothetical protein